MREEGREEQCKTKGRTDGGRDGRMMEGWKDAGGMMDG